MKRRNNTKIFVLIAVMTVGLCLVGCTDSADEITNVFEESDEETIVKPNGKTVGISMPTRTSERWIIDCESMSNQLEALGYSVVAEFADDDIEKQVSQIEEMVEQNVDCLVIAAIDSLALVEVEARAKEMGIPVVAYDRLLMDTDAVSYYATFDNYMVGRLVGEYIEEEKELAKAKENGASYTIEFFMGSPDDNNATFYYEGVMDVLGGYLEDGTLVCKSGKTSFEDTCILRWDQEKAREKCAQHLQEYYQEETLDICCSVFDGFAFGCIDALWEAGYDPEENWPVITGQDAEYTAITNIIDGYQSMTVYKDARLLSQKCVTMVQAVLEGAEPEINDTEQYDNGVIKVPSYLCTPVAVDEDNYEEIIIDGGYYTEEELGLD